MHWEFDDNNIHVYVGMCTIHVIAQIVRHIKTISN